jgi:hypothetical protein
MDSDDVDWMKIWRNEAVDKKYEAESVIFSKMKPFTSHIM